jgi:pimeloyl-ACP methyl ester carboxylesterase
VIVEDAVPVRGVPRCARLALPDAEVMGTIVFVHGSGDATADDFAWYTAQLNGLGAACLVVDKVMDGYGRLRRDYDALASDAVEALAWAHSQPGLQGSPVALLGYSEGSWVATKAAARHPELVDLLVLCSAPLTRPRSQTAYHWAHLKPSRSSPARTLRHLLMAAALAALSDYGNVDITADLRSIPAPVVLVLGEDDPTIDVDRACRIFADTRGNVPPPILVPRADHALPPDSDWVAQVAGLLITGAGRTG